jgi:hypothetical protein
MDKITLPEKNRLIIPILVIEELTITDKIDKKPGLVKAVLRIMMRRKNSKTNNLVQPSLPFFYLHYIGDTNPPVFEKADSFLEFTKRMANNLETPEFIEATKEYRENRNNVYKEFVVIINDYAAEVRAKITDKEAHKKFDATNINRELIEDWVFRITEQHLPENFDWNQIELFMATMGVYFKKLELGEFTMAYNDAFDLFMLMYVQPGDKYWTFDKTWNELIVEAGMKKYIYYPKGSQKK